MRATPRTLRLVAPLLGAFFVSLQACGSDEGSTQAGTPSAGSGGTAGAAGAKAGAGGNATAGTSAAGTSAAGSSSGGAAGKSGGATGGNAAGGAAGGGLAKPGEPCVTNSDCGLVGIETQPAACAEAFCRTNVCALRATDTDGDGFRRRTCKLVSDGAFTIELGGDCDDGNKDVNPKAWDGPAGDGQPNRCGDGVDQDCSGVDGDAVTAAGASCSCTPDDVEACGQTSSGTPVDYPGGKPAPGSVCTLGSRTCIKDPTTGGGKWGPCTNAIGPSQEICNTKDDDCDGQTDEDDAQGKPEWIYDGDGDGYRATVPGAALPGTPFESRFSCAKPSGVPKECDSIYCGATPSDACCPADRWRLANTAPNPDCDDRDAQVNPAAAEICATPTRDKDDNCNGQKDEKPAVGEQIYYRDVDGDGYGDTKTPGVQQCGAPGPEWKAGIPQTDCDDAKGGVNPGVTKEDCVTPEDDNCNGTAKDGCGCTVGDPPLDCGTPADCVYLPGASICDNGAYTACPKAIDKGVYCPDLDDDGACDKAACGSYCPSVQGASTQPTVPPKHRTELVCTAKDSDCADNDAARTPGAKELCGDGIDNDCVAGDSNGFGLGTACDLGPPTGACAGGGKLVCQSLESTRCDGDGVPSAALNVGPAPNGSCDWNCDGTVENVLAVDARDGLTCTTTIQVRGGSSGKPWCVDSFPPPNPAPPQGSKPSWTSAACIHLSLAPTEVRPTCADLPLAACETHYYFTDCRKPVGGGLGGIATLTCPDACGKEIERLMCKVTNGACVSATPVSFPSCTSAFTLHR